MAWRKIVTKTKKGKKRIQYKSTGHNSYHTPVIFAEKKEKSR